MYLFNIDHANFETNYFEAARHIDVNCPLHLHYAMEVVCVKRGTVVMQVGEDVRSLHAGECTLILPLEAHSFESAESSECFVIVFSPEWVPDVYEQIDNCVPTVPVCRLPEEIFLLCDKSLPTEPLRFGDLRARALLYPLTVSLLERCAFVPTKKSCTGKVFLEAVRYVGRYFCTEDVSLNVTAKKLGVHPVYLSRTFRENSGISYTGYVNAVRVSHAARLLVETPDKTVSEAAYESGFGSIRHFNRAFKALYGTTPTQFLERERT